MPATAKKVAEKETFGVTETQSVGQKEELMKKQDEESPVNLCTDFKRGRACA